MTKPDTPGTWMTRYGKLIDVIERSGKKGPYISFKLQAKGFVQFGACFDEQIIPQMKAAVGKEVWMRGPVDVHKRIGKDGKPVDQSSYKVMTFKLSDPKALEEQAAAA